MSASDDFDDIIDRLRKMFNLKSDSDMFDVDFYFMPGMNKNPEEDIDDEKKKAFKVSYHFDSSMDKPEINFEGDLDKEKLQDYLKNLKKLYPDRVKNLKKLAKAPQKKEIDAKELSLEPCPADDDVCEIEPYAEVNDFEEFSEIIIEAPRITLDDVILTYGEQGYLLIFSAEEKNRSYYKEIRIPFRSSLESTSIDVNNGLVKIIANKEEETYSNF